MKKLIYAVIVILLVGAGSIWKHSEVQERYKNFHVEEKVVKKSDFPIHLTNETELKSFSKIRDSNTVTFTLDIYSQKDNIVFKTNDFALAYNTNHRGIDFSDFDPADTKINNKNTDILQKGKNTVVLSTVNDPDSEEATLFYLVNHQNGRYTQLEFKD